MTLLTLLQMYQENPEKDFFDEVMDLIGTDSKDSAAVAVRLSSIVVHSCVLLLTYHRIRAPPQTSEWSVFPVETKLCCVMKSGVVPGVVQNQIL